MKKRLKILLSICAVIIILVIAAALIIPMLDLTGEAADIEVGSIDLTYVQNGTYRGEYTVDLVSVSLTVEVKNNSITSINIDEHDNGLGKKAEVITEDIISKQSLDVDCISGATISSIVIRKAIETAFFSKAN